MFCKTGLQTQGKWKISRKAIFRNSTACNTLVCKILKSISHKRILSKEVLHIWALQISFNFSLIYLSQKTNTTFFGLPYIHKMIFTCLKTRYKSKICQMFKEHKYEGLLLKGNSYLKSTLAEKRPSALGSIDSCCACLDLGTSNRK